MRVSLNLYKQPMFRGTSAAGVKDGSISKKADRAADAVNTTDDTAANPLPGAAEVASIRHGVLPRKKDKYDYNKNLEILNLYIMNTSPHEEFHTFPLKPEEMTDYKNFDKVIHYFQNPRELVQYYTDFFDTRIRYGDEKNKIMKAATDDLMAKINFDMLGIDYMGLTSTDKVKLAALFDFWSVTLDGKPRNGHERPEFVRSTREYFKRLERGNMYGSVKRDKDHLLGSRIGKEERKADDKIQKAYDEEYEQAVKARKERSIFRRGPRPVRKLSPLNKFLDDINVELMEIARKASRSSSYTSSGSSYDPNLDMAKAWHEFLGGEWD